MNAMRISGTFDVNRMPNELGAAALFASEHMNVYPTAGFRTEVLEEDSGYLVRFIDTEQGHEYGMTVSRRTARATLRIMKAAESPASDDTAVLRFATRLLPSTERGEWLEEQRGYLTDLSTRRERWVWILAQFIAMPRYAYTVRTGRERESA